MIGYIPPIQGSRGGIYDLVAKWLLLGTNLALALIR
jgi:hypothetical protein